MKNTSIKKRVTLYYSVTLIIITAMVFGVFLLTADVQKISVAKKTLMFVVEASFENVEYENNILEIDDDFTSYSKGAVLLVYSENGDLIKGSVPAGFPAKTPLTSANCQEIETDSDTWMVYDLCNTYENGQSLWVRGIYAMDDLTTTVTSVMKIMSCLLPFILLVAIFAGFRITRRAFLPIADITESAGSISNGNDLSKRLPCGETKDELYYLTETLNQMLERLDTAFKSEKSFTYDVSHELKTPIAVILAECEYVLEENRTPEVYKESLENINSQCKRTLSLIQQLLQLSRTINTNTMLDREKFDLSQLCGSIVDELSLMAEKRDILLQSKLQENVTINADETLIMRMIINLMSNAMKYSRNENPFVKLSLTKDTEDKIKLAVEDNGIGIDAEDQKMVFNRFYKAEKSRKTEKDSFGLGLAMVEWIVNAHGGSIELESTPGVGSTFTITLPVGAE